MLPQPEEVLKDIAPDGLSNYHQSAINAMREYGRLLLDHLALELDASVEQSILKIKDEL
jgi:hypothetical protein